MLPSSKGSPDGEVEIEVLDDDLVLVHEPHELYVPSPPLSRRSSPFLLRDLRAEDDVATACAASIAAEATRARAADRVGVTVVPPPATSCRLSSPVTSRLPPPTPPPPSSSSAMSSRLPPLASPPPPAVSSEEPATVKLPALSDDAARKIVGEMASASASVPPITVPAPAESVVVVRERPRSAWLVGSAILGAAAAIAAMRLATSEPTPSPAVAVPAVAPVATEAPTAVGASTSTALVERPSAVVRFGEDQAVSIGSPATTAPSKAPHPSHTTAKATPPPAPSSTMIPDAPALSGRAETSRAAVDPAPTATSAQASKKKLTPEQELAEAQLKASMK